MPTREGGRQTLHVWSTSVASRSGKYRSGLQDFEGREGTGDEGKDFEELMIISKCLELALDANVTKFSISSDDKGFGDFDDVVVEAEFREGGNLRTAFQLKHIEEEKKLLTPTILGSIGKKFSISKYYQSSDKIPQNFSLILYTNKHFQMVDDKILMNCKIGANDVLVDIVKTSRQHVYEFKIHESQSNISKNEIDAYTNFLKRFQLMSNQENTRDLQNRIMEEFHQLHGTEDTFHRFRDFIRKWKKKKKKRNKLDKNLVVIKLVESLLSPYIKTTSGTHAYTDFGVILRKAILNFKITSFEETNDVIDKIWFNSKSDNEINRCGFKNFLLTDQLDKIKGEKLKARKYSIISWYLGQCPLIIDVTKELESTINHAIELLAKNQIEDKRLLLLHHKHKCQDSEIFQNLYSLETVNEGIFSETLEKFFCSMQGRLRKLKDFVNSKDTSKIITTDCLVKMAHRKFNLGGEAEELPEFYVERVLPRIIIDFKFVDKAETNDLVLISCDDDKEVVRQQISDVKIVEVRELIHTNSSDSIVHQHSRLDTDIGKNKNIICLHPSEFSTDELSIISKKFPGRNVHHFKYSNNHLEWIQSSGSIKALKRYRLENHIFHKEEDFLQHSKNKTKIICANPGMGKSSLLKSLKNSCQNSYWPVYISVNDHMSGIEANRDVQQFLFSLLKTNEKYEKSLVQMFYDNRKILFLFDGIDELLDEQQRRVVYSFIKKIEELGFLQCIASRSNLKEELERKFNTFSTNINEFNTSEQNQYITDRLSKKFNTRQLSEIISKINENVKYLEAHAILGVPMQLFMLTELFLQSEDVETVLKQPLTATKLFNHFVNLKFEMYFKKKHGSRNREDTITKEAIIERCKFFAVKICLNDIVNAKSFLYTDGLSKIIADHPTGFIVKAENTFAFTHRSYAEYFAAMFLEHHYSQIDNFKTVYFDDRLRNVRFMLDLMLAQDCPAHAAVLYRNLDTLEENKKDILKEDKLGRNTLHLALLWSKEHLTLPDLLKEVRLEDYLKNFKVVRQILKYLSDSQQKLTNISDKFFQMDYESYSSQCFFDLAVVTNDIDVVKFVSKNCEPNWKNALIYATSIGNVEICEFVISQGKEIDSQGKKYETPLMISAAKGYCEIAKMLIDNRAKVNKTDIDGWSALHFAVECNQLLMVQLLIETKVDINHRTKEGATPLLLAAGNGYQEIAALLIDNKADVNSSTLNRTTPLMWAAAKGYLKIAEILIDNYAEVNMTNTSGGSALHFAVDFNQLLIVQLLVKSKADLNAQTREGATPLILAAENGYTEIANLLLDNNPDGMISIIQERSKAKGHLEIAKTPIRNEINMANKSGYYSFIKSRACVNICEGETPPRIAVRKGYSENAELSINKNNVNYSTPQGTTLLMLAAKKGYLKIANMLVDRNANVNKSDNDGWSPLHFAAECNQLPIIQLLIKSNADVNRQTKDGATSLLIAVMERNSIIAKCLSENKADVNSSTFREQTPLIWAAKKGYFEIADTLINNNADVNKTNNDGWTALHFAADYNQLRTAQSLIKGSANVNHQSKGGETALLLAVRNGHLEVAKFLIDNKADVNFSNLRGATPLTCAAEKGHLEIAKVLIRNNAEVNKPNEYYCTPLHFAAEYNQWLIVQLLILSNADVNSQTRMGSTPLILAVKIGYSEIAGFLISCKADVNMTDHDGWSPLHFAVENNQLLMVQLLIQSDADVNHRTKDDATPLIRAIKNGYWEIVEFLIDDEVRYVSLERASTPLTPAAETPLLVVVGSGNWEISKRLIDINIRYVNPERRTAKKDYLEIAKILIYNNFEVNKTDNDGRSLLHFAAKYNQLPMAQLLIKNNANVNHQTEDGETPVQIAIQYEHSDIAKILIDYNADVNITDNCGWSPLHFAAEYNQLTIVKLLIESNSAVNHSTKTGVTPLTIAAEKGYLKIARLLIDHKANVNSATCKGTTSLMWAAMSGCLKIAKILIDNNAQINETDSNGRSALYFAVEYNKVLIVQLLLKNNAYVNHQTKWGATPLMRAAYRGHSEIAKLLIDNKADVNCSTLRETTALMWTAEKGYPDIAIILIDNNAEINKTNKSGWSALHFSVDNNELSMVKLLVQNNASVNLVSNDFETPMMLAARNGYSEIIAFLTGNNQYGQTSLDLPDLTGVDNHLLSNKLQRKETLYRRFKNSFKRKRHQ